jgi:hypothetical protein
MTFAQNRIIFPVWFSDWLAVLQLFFLLFLKKTPNIKAKYGHEGEYN